MGINAQLLMLDLFGMNWENYGKQDGWVIDHKIPLKYYKNNDMCELVNDENTQINVEDCKSECPDNSYELNNKCVCIDRRKVLNRYDECTR